MANRAVENLQKGLYPTELRKAVEAKIPEIRI